jgi:pyridoxamine 5'-phosphate oxidase
MNPLQTLENWLQEAEDADIPLPESMTLATVAPDGAPSARVVLHKGVTGGAIVFGTQLDSRKGRDLRADPRVALVYHWPQLGRQVRVAGRAEVAGEAESDALWASRGRDARLVEVVADPGRPLESLGALRERFARADEQQPDEPPRPGGWFAVHVIPERIEFWAAGERRLAEREEWVRRDGGGWDRRWLEP